MEYILASHHMALYGSDLTDTGFRFEWDSTDLKLEPGSTHFIYIYYYNTESGWDYIRNEINITGQKSGDADIKIFVDEPAEPTPRRESDEVTRGDRMRVLCPECRSKVSVIV